MKYGYLLAYTDDTEHKDRLPWIHPTHPLRKKYVDREYTFLEKVAKAELIIPFRVELDNIPEYITWEFVEKNKIKQ